MSPSPTAIVGRKLQSLDGLRAFAIILVFFHHMRLQFPVVNTFTLYLSKYVAQGWMGVDLFFVLSGFLITGILLDTREATNYFGGFYARRVLRIFPLYYVVLTLVLVLGGLANSPQLTATLPAAPDRWLYYCYLTNWLALWKGQWGPNYLAHFWSLAVEEQFYLVWPLVVWLIRPRAIPWVAAGLAVLAALTRLVWVAQGGSGIAICMATISKMDALFIGALCACLFRQSGAPNQAQPEVQSRASQIRPWLPWIAVAGIGSFFAVFSAMLFFPHQAALLLYGPTSGVHSLDDAVLFFMECGGYSLLAVGFGALVLLAAVTEGENSWLQKILSSRVLAPIGLYSYGIYVFHVPIIGAGLIYVVPKILPGDRSDAATAFVECVYFVVVAAITFGISALSYEFFEKNVLRFKRHFGAKYAAQPKEETPQSRSLSATAGNL